MDVNWVSTRGRRRRNLFPRGGVGYKAHSDPAFLERQP